MRLEDKIDRWRLFKGKKLLFLLDPEAPITIHSPTEGYGVAFVIFQGYPLCVAGIIFFFFSKDLTEL